MLNLIIHELFYFLTFLIVFGVLAEIFWIGFASAYLNFNILLIIWGVLCMVVLMQTKQNKL